MVIRAYQPFDAVPLAALFYQTVHTAVSYTHLTLPTILLV